MRLNVARTGRFNAKGCIVAVVILVFTGCIAIGIAIWRGRVWRDRLTAETPATVTNVTFREAPRRPSRDTTLVSYSYTVGGRDYTGERIESGRSTEYSTGAPRKACYDPANPSVSMLVAPDYQCGQ